MVIEAQVQHGIARYYRCDQARGDQVRELRGAFTPSRPIAQETP
jgi:hypothetical protein